MVEGGVDTISDTLDNISLSSTADQRHASDKALNMDDCNMLPDEMVEKMKRREKEKERGKREPGTAGPSTGTTGRRRTPETSPGTPMTRT